MSAPQVQPVASDAAARSAALTRFERPLLLVAGAGTGKTTALVGRVVSWCLGVGWERACARSHRSSSAGPLGAAEFDRTAADVLARVVAITFTEAAAAEMAERVGSFFARIAAGEIPVGMSALEMQAGDGDARSREHARRASALLGSLDHLRVSTIHGFCHRLLARHPIEAGLHPRFEVDADERIQAEVVREVLEAGLCDAGRCPGSSPLLELAAEGFGLRDLEQALTCLLRAGVSADALARDPLPPLRVRAALADLRKCAASLNAQAAAVGSGDRVPAGTAALQAALVLTQQAAGPSVAADGASLARFVAELSSEWEGHARRRLTAWGRGEFLSSERDRLGGEALEVARLARSLQPLLQGFLELDPRRLALARAALVPMLERACRLLHERGAVGYGSLLIGARDLLRTRPQLRASIRAGIDQLLVDEFQDTDPVQCEIIRWLALDGPVEDRPGLFLVGDPKQSIYGWRGADLGAYDDFAKELEANGGETHLLSVNFRSAPPILREVERVIEPVMQRRVGRQPAFERLSACDSCSNDPGFVDGDFAPVEHWVSWRWDPAVGARAEKTRAPEAANLEARALAADIRALHEQHGVPWGDVAVLFRAMSDVEDYLVALREHDVPYAVERERGYYRRREVVDAAALVRCVLDPNDSLALLTLLRSAAVGVPDAALIPLWSGALPQRVAQLDGVDARQLASLDAFLRETAAELLMQPEPIPGIERISGWEVNALAAIETVAALRHCFECDPVDVFVERIRTLHLGEVAEASRHLGSFRVANLERFFRELTQALAAGESRESLLRRLRSEPGSERESEAEGSQASERDAVAVMTIHKAKGLDFEHVYVMQLHKTAGSARLPDAAVCVLGAGIEYRLLGAGTLGFAAVREREAAVEAAERVRTLYVAMTRARRRLVLAGRWPTARVAPDPDRASSHADLLPARAPLDDDPWRASEAQDLGDCMSELAGAAGRAWRDADGARWRFPALASASAAGRRSDRAGLGLPSLAALTRESRVLRQRQQQARCRMARPWRASASASAQRAADPAPCAPRTDSARSAAAAGTIVHRVLEELDLDLEVEVAMQELRKRVPALVAGACREPIVVETTRLAEQVLDRFEAGPLMSRFERIRREIVARELPVWLAPSAGDSGPVAVVSGVIDLVYRDARDGRFVVVDFKSDRIEGDSRIEARAADYTEQAARYVEALALALELDERPRFELWFLHAGRVVELRV